MSHFDSTDRLGEIVASLLDGKGYLTEDGKATREAERKTGIARETLDRKMTSGEFTARELILIGRAVGKTFSSIARMVEAAA